MKRICDLFLGIGFFFVLILPMVLIAIAICLTSKGPVLYWSNRVGKYNKIFKMFIISLNSKQPII